MNKYRKTFELFRYQFEYKHEKLKDIDELRLFGDVLLDKVNTKDNLEGLTLTYISHYDELVDEEVRASARVIKNDEAELNIVRETLEFKEFVNLSGKNSLKHLRLVPLLSKYKKGKISLKEFTKEFNLIAKNLEMYHVECHDLILLVINGK